MDWALAYQTITRIVSGDVHWACPNTLRPRLIGHRFTNSIFKRIFVWNFFKIQWHLFRRVQSTAYVSIGLANTWYRRGHYLNLCWPISLTHISVQRAQCVDMDIKTQLEYSYRWCDIMHHQTLIRTLLNTIDSWWTSSIFNTMKYPENIYVKLLNVHKSL